MLIDTDELDAFLAKASADQIRRLGDTFTSLAKLMATVADEATEIDEAAAKGKRPAPKRPAPKKASRKKARAAKADPPPAPAPPRLPPDGRDLNGKRLTPIRQDRADKNRPGSGGRDVHGRNL